MAQDGPKMSPTGPQDGPRWPPESWAIKQTAARSARGSRARVAARTKCRRNTIRLMSITFVATTRMFFARHVAKGHSGQRNVASNVAVSVEYTRTWWPFGGSWVGLRYANSAPWIRCLSMIITLREFRGSIMYRSILSADTASKFFHA